MAETNWRQRIKDEYQELTEEQDSLLQELIELQATFNKAGNPGRITRGFWRAHSNSKESEVEKSFGSWKNFSESADNAVDETVEHIKRVDKLERQIASLQKDKRALVSRLGARDELLQEINEATAKRYKGLDIPRTKIKKSGALGLLNLSDWHLGQRIDPATVGNLNEYNLATAKQRINSIVAQVVDAVKTYRITWLTIAFIGDLLDGAIHDEQARTWECSPTKSLVFAQDLIMSTIRTLARHTALEVVFIAGNHSRLSDKVSYQDGAVFNLEYILGETVKTIASPIPVNVPESLMYNQTVGSTVYLLTHGHTLSGGSGGFPGFPIGPLAQAAAKLYGIDGGEFDHLVIGHFHRSARLPLFNGGNLYANSSTVGLTPFGAAKIKAPSDISQTLIVCDSQGRPTIDLVLTAHKPAQAGQHNNRRK